MARMLTLSVNKKTHSMIHIEIIISSLVSLNTTKNRFCQHFPSSVGPIKFLIAKLIFINIRGSITPLPFVYTLTEEMLVKPYKCLSAYLIPLVDKNKIQMPVLPDFFLTNTYLTRRYLY